MTFRQANAGRAIRRCLLQRRCARSRHCAAWRRRKGREETKMASEVDTTLDTIDIDGLLRLLPHRYPFLLVDRIHSIDGDNSAVGIKNVTFNEPHFLGHFPGQPVM